MFGLVEWRGAGERCGAREKRLDGVRFLAVGIRRGDGLRRCGACVPPRGRWNGTV